MWPEVLVSNGIIFFLTLNLHVDSILILKLTFGFTTFSWAQSTKMLKIGPIYGTTTSSDLIMKEHAAHKICSSLEWSKMVPKGFPLIINHPRWIHWRPCPLWCWLGRPWKCKYSRTSPTLQSRQFGKRKSSIWHTHPTSAFVKTSVLISFKVVIVSYPPNGQTQGNQCYTLEGMPDNSTFFIPPEMTR